MSAAYVSTLGVPGFFEPRFPPAPLMPRGSPAALSIYDSSPLKETLAELVDFDIVNSVRGAPERRRGQHPQRQLRLFRFRTT